MVSPVFAFVFKIAPVFAAVLPIMVGNVCYVLILSWLLGKSFKPVWKQPMALGTAAVVKFGALYLLGVKLLGGVMFAVLDGVSIAGNAVMSEKVLKQLMNMFAWPQLVTALLGGAVALLVAPVLRKALKR